MLLTVQGIRRSVFSNTLIIKSIVHVLPPTDVEEYMALLYEGNLLSYIQQWHLKKHEHFGNSNCFKAPHHLHWINLFTFIFIQERVHDYSCGMDHTVTKWINLAGCPHELKCSGWWGNNWYLQREVWDGRFVFKNNIWVANIRFQILKFALRCNKK